MIQNHLSPFCPSVTYFAKSSPASFLHVSEGGHGKAAKNQEARHTAWLLPGRFLPAQLFPSWLLPPILPASPVPGSSLPPAQLLPASCPAPPSLLLPASCPASFPAPPCLLPSFSLPGFSRPASGLCYLPSGLTLTVTSFCTLVAVELKHNKAVKETQKAIVTEAPLAPLMCGGGEGLRQCSGLNVKCSLQAYVFGHLVSR